jgi:hypothetical protein
MIHRPWPRWARRDHPLVRRHLGGQPAAPLELQATLGWLGIQALLIGVWLVLPGLFHTLSNLQQPALSLLASSGAFLYISIGLLFFPINLLQYSRYLLAIGLDALGAMYAEQRQDTFDLLRATPMSFEEICLGKIMAGYWGRADGLEGLLRLSSALMLPPLLVSTGLAWQTSPAPGVLPILLLVGMAVSTVRLLIEPVMIGALGILLGATVTFRAAGTIWLVLLGAAYFALLNLTRLTPLSVPLRLLVEYVLPLALPVAVTWLALRLTRRLLLRG